MHFRASSRVAGKYAANRYSSVLLTGWSWADAPVSSRPSRRLDGFEPGQRREARAAAYVRASRGDGRPAAAPTAAGGRVARRIRSTWFRAAWTTGGDRMAGISRGNGMWAIAGADGITDAIRRRMGDVTTAITTRTRSGRWRIYQPDRCGENRSCHQYESEPGCAHVRTSFLQLLLLHNGEYGGECGAHIRR
jgi:hypothetical protein